MFNFQIETTCKLQIKLVASCNLEANIRQRSMSGLGTVSLSGLYPPMAGHAANVQMLDGHVRLGTPSLSGHGLLPDVCL